MNISIGQIMVWLIVGALSGSLAGRLFTRSRRGFGFFGNLLVGLVGALIGGFLFRVFNISLGLGEFSISFEDLLAAFAGSVLFVVLLRFIRR